MIFTKETKVRIPDSLYSDMVKLAEENNTSMNQTIEQALKFYRDYTYMGNKATFVNEELLKVIQANNALLLQQINNKSNKLLSELAIQSAIQNMILASELDVSSAAIDAYRKKAVEFLTINNRCLRLDEITE